jgi:phosphate transport system substrate-binding protein
MSGMRGGTMLLVVGLLVAGWGCASGSATPSAAPANIGFEEPEIRSIRVAGSDTMLHLGRRLAAAFMEGHPGVVVRVEGGGTARGVEALIAGDVDLCAASRPLTASEVQRLHATRQVLGVQHLVAMDAIVVMVHPSVGITALTSEQIADLFQGRVRSWADLGGADLDVVPIRRSASSGTHRLMRDILLAGGGFRPDAVVVATSAAMVATVAEVPGAIGYGRLDRNVGVHLIQVDGVDPDPEGVISGAYPLGRYLYLYTAAPADGGSRLFLEWVLGPRGQEIVGATGFIPLWVPRAAPGPV